MSEMKFITKVCSHIRYNKKNSALNWIDHYSEKRICALFRIILNSTQKFDWRQTDLYSVKCAIHKYVYTQISVSKYQSSLGK